MSEFSFLLVLANQLINPRNLNSKGIKTPELVVEADLRVQEVGDHDEVERPNGQHKTLFLVPDIRKEKQIEHHVVDKVSDIFLSLLLVVVNPCERQEKVHYCGVLWNLNECVIVPRFFAKEFTQA
jgi:hypothetical protein